MFVAFIMEFIGLVRVVESRSAVVQIKDQISKVMLVGFSHSIFIGTRRSISVDAMNQDNRSLSSQISGICLN